MGVQKVDNDKSGATKNSTEGGQFPFLPGAGTMSNGGLGNNGGTSKKSGQSNMPSETRYDHVPENYKTGLRKGKK